MITASELLAAAHEADLQLNELSNAAEALRQAEPQMRELQTKLRWFKDAACAVLGNKLLRVQLTNANALESRMFKARDSVSYLELTYGNDSLGEFTRGEHVRQ